MAWSGCIRSRQYRWHDIDTAAQFWTLRGSDFTRPGEHDRRSRSGLVRTAFGMTVIAISVFPLNPAIVRNINDQGIVPNASAFQTIQELPAGLVKPLAHGVVLGNEFAVHQLFVFVEQVRAAYGAYEAERGIPDEEWLFLLLLRR